MSLLYKVIRRFNPQNRNMTFERLENPKTTKDNDIANIINAIVSMELSIATSAIYSEYKQLGSASNLRHTQPKITSDDGDKIVWSYQLINYPEYTFWVVSYRN